MQKECILKDLQVIRAQILDLWMKSPSEELWNLYKAMDATIQIYVRW